MNPTEDQAYQFAVMLQAGLPASEAIQYFVEVDDPAELAMLLKRWTRSRVVKLALAKLQKKSWQEMTLQERMQVALDQHYNTLAYLLYSNNYIEANSTEKQKLDTARGAIESKMAGTAGKASPLDQFFSDLNSGKLTLPKIPSKIN